MKYTSVSKIHVGAQPAYKPEGLGLQIFGLITLLLVINWRCWGELKILRGQSVGEVSAGLRLVKKLAMP